MGLQRWFYAGGRPNWLARLLDRGTAAVSARGVGPDRAVGATLSRVPDRAEKHYLSGWIAWNHVRAAAAVFTIALFV